MEKTLYWITLIGWWITVNGFCNYIFDSSIKKDFHTILFRIGVMMMLIGLQIEIFLDFVF